MIATIAGVFRPCEKKRILAYETALVLCGSFLIALCSQISVFLPFSPVPVTAQTFAVLIIGALFGSKRGALCILCYLAEGGMGFPVFSSGRAGLAMLAGPTGGYLFGFVAAAYVVGFLAEHGWVQKIGSSILTMAMGDIILLGFGVIWLSFIVGIKAAFFSGLYPFIVGDCIKILLAAFALPIGWKLIAQSK